MYNIHSYIKFYMIENLWGLMFKIKSFKDKV